MAAMERTGEYRSMPTLLPGVWISPAGKLEKSFKKYTKQEWDKEMAKGGPQQVLETLMEVTLMEAEHLAPELEEISLGKSKELEPLLQALKPITKGQSVDQAKLKRKLLNPNLKDNPKAGSGKKRKAALPEAMLSENSQRMLTKTAKKPTT